MIGKLGRLAHGHPLWTLALMAAATVAALGSASRLEMDTDLVALLPTSYRSVQDLDELGRRFGSVGFVIVVGRGGTPESRRRFVRDVAPRLEQIEGVRYVEAERPYRFLLDHALYFLDRPDLEALHDGLVARERWERRRRNPLYVDFEGEEAAPSLEFPELRAKYRARASSLWPGVEGGGPPDAVYDDPAQRMVALFVRPARRATDLDFTRGVVARVQAVADEIDPNAYGDDFEVALTGRFKKRVDEQALVTGDLGWATALALLLVLGYLALHFRRVAAVALVVAPLVVGLAWTFGAAAAMFGTLNLVTGFIGAILLGLGVDHGIHLLGRYQAERAAGRDGSGAVAAMLGDTGRAVVVAALTTIASFLGVALSEFRAFREFGVVAAVGLCLVVLAYTLGLPALLALLERATPRAPAPHPASPFLRALPRRAGRLLGLSAVVLGGLVACLPLARFDVDFESLGDQTLPSYVLDDRVGRLLGYSKSPVLVLTEDAEQERAAAAALRGVREARGADSTLDFVSSLADLVPAGQAEKRPVIERIGRVVRRIKPTWLDEADRPLLEDARRMVDAAPFTRADLPPELRRVFTGPAAGPEEGFVLAFPGISTADGRAVRRLKAELESVDLLPGRRLPVAAESLVLADILDMLLREAPPVLAWTLGLVLACLWALLGGLRPALRCFGAATLSVLATLGLAGLAGVSLTYLNVVVVPVLFGVAVDGAVHLTVRGVADAEDTLRAIAGATLTTALGFGTLALVHHPGLRSIGVLALLGLGVNLLVSLVAFPALLARSTKTGARRIGSPTPLAR